ncbi:M50 family metallopeptidase [Weissella cibaria]|uniref:M50 family metallopeptidase n=1 Tax=Weissella cibaria TaxID=137591 RepID=UPI001E38E8B0|nr:M50 family metallopeptidase [Weissella cibaria]
MWFLYLIISWFGAVFLHECGHCLAAVLMRVEISQVGVFGIVLERNKKIRFSKFALGGYVQFINDKPTTLNLALIYAGGAFVNIVTVLLLWNNTNEFWDIFSLMSGGIAAGTLIPLSSLRTDGSMLLSLLVNSKETIVYYRVSHLLINKYTEEFGALVNQVISVLDDGLRKIPDGHIIIYVSYLNYFSSLQNNQIDPVQRVHINKVFDRVANDRNMSSRYYKDYLAGEVMTHNFLHNSAAIFHKHSTKKMPELLKKRLTYFSDSSNEVEKRAYLSEILKMDQGDCVSMIKGELSYLDL